jgi:hypothetical protein
MDMAVRLKTDDIQGAGRNQEKVVNEARRRKMPWLYRTSTQHTILIPGGYPKNMSS